MNTSEDFAHRRDLIAATTCWRVNLRPNRIWSTNFYELVVNFQFTGNACPTSSQQVSSDVLSQMLSYSFCHGYAFDSLLMTKVPRSPSSQPRSYTQCLLRPLVCTLKYRPGFESLQSTTLSGDFVSEARRSRTKASHQNDEPSVRLQLYNVRLSKLFWISILSERTKAWPRLHYLCLLLCAF